MWSALPISTSYSEPYLFIYTEKSIDIYNILTGIWLRTFSLTDTYPLTLDGSISLSYDVEFDKHYGKLIYISEENTHGKISLEIPEKISPKVLGKREGLFRNPKFNSSKLSLEISEPTDFRHVEHFNHAGGNDGPTLPLQRYLSTTSEENSFNQSYDSLTQNTRPTSQ